MIFWTCSQYKGQKQTLQSIQRHAEEISFCEIPFSVMYSETRWPEDLAL